MPARPSLTAVPSTPAAPSADASPLRAWLTSAESQYLQRGPVLRALALAMICARPINVLLVGPPGTAKTAISHAFASACGARFLARTLSPWTDAAELLGPVDLAALQRGELQRATSITRPTLLDADMVLTDELPRASPGIRAMMLSALSDRRTPSDDPVPAHVIVAGANTRLTSEEDRALVDRFALRVEVPRLMSAPDLRAVLTREVTVNGAPQTSAALPALPVGLVAALRAHSATVDLPGDVADALTSLALALRQPAPSGASYPDVSERRWVLTTRVLQASATLSDRSTVEWSDLTSTLPMILDDGPESRAAVANAITACVPRYVRALDDLDAAITTATERARRVGGVVDIRPGEADEHAKRAETFDALLSALRPYGASVIAQAEDRIERGNDAIDAAYVDGANAYNAARKARR